MRRPGVCAKIETAGLAVIRRAAPQIAANRHADHHRARPVVARAVPHHRQLVANLHERRPDVVEELDLDHRLEAAQRHADRPADDVGLGKRRVEHARAAVEPLQPVRDLEDATLAGTERERLFAAGVRHVLAEDDDPRVAGHLVLQRGVDGRHHRVGLAVVRGSVAKSADVGSTSGEKTKSAGGGGIGLGRP